MTHAQLRPYSSHALFFPISAIAHAEAWSLYRELFPPPGCCFVPPEVTANTVQPPSAHPPEPTSLEAVAIAIAEKADKAEIARWAVSPAPSGTPPLPPANSDANLAALCEARWGAALARSQPTLVPTYSSSEAHQTLVMQRPTGGRVLVWVPVPERALAAAAAADEARLGSGMRLAEVDAGYRA